MFQDFQILVLFPVSTRNQHKLQTTTPQITQTTELKSALTNFLKNSKILLGLSILFLLKWLNSGSSLTQVIYGRLEWWFSSSSQLSFHSKASLKLKPLKKSRHVSLRFPVTFLKLWRISSENFWSRLLNLGLVLKILKTSNHTNFSKGLHGIALAMNYLLKCLTWLKHNK